MDEGKVAVSPEVLHRVPPEMPGAILNREQQVTQLLENDGEGIDDRWR